VRIERVPRLAIDGDRIEQVITNLLDNAIRYSPSGGTIAVSVGSDDRHVRISVADEGIGIAPEHVAHIFDRFYQAHRREQRGGMGLGLYISQQIVLAHGGDIAVEVLPRGTRFTVTLPLRLARAEPSAPPGSRRSIVRGAERATAAPEGGRTILVVEDEGAIRSILSAVLSEAGYRVVLADDGAHALRILDDLQPDLIVLDKLMPELDGTGFAKAYRMTPGRHAPILALCAARDAAEWAGRIGAVGWISKPFDMDDLLNEVRRVLAIETPLGSIHSIA
jgi:CheY-like chemotaxis protein